MTGYRRSILTQVPKVDLKMLMVSALQTPVIPRFYSHLLIQKSRLRQILRQEKLLELAEKIGKRDES